MKTKRKYVVLRSVQRAGRDPFAAPAFEAAVSFPGVRTETLELRRGEVMDLSTERATLALAPAMPMALIQPRDTHDVRASEVAGCAWGVKAVGAMESPFTGEGAVVAILDTGIDPNHAAFDGIEIIQRNFTDDAEGNDRHGHGTHCAGTIFGRSVDGVRMGVAPGVRRALIGKVLGADGGSSGRIAEAIQWALANGANVVSMSLGIDFPGYANSLRAEGLPEAAAISMALEGYRYNVHLFEKLAAYLGTQHGPAMLVAAAGNESGRDKAPPFEVAVSPPAVSDGFVSVAALSHGADGLDVAPFSNTGANLAAPGVEVLSARLGGGLQAMSGTSMATPHVAGVAALWAQKLRGAGLLTGPNLHAHVIASCTLAGLRNGVDVTDVGSGLVRAPMA